MKCSRNPLRSLQLQDNCTPQRLKVSQGAILVISIINKNRDINLAINDHATMEIKGSANDNINDKALLR